MDIDLLSRQEAASLLQWWLDAGVDVAVAEEQRRWLAAPAAAPAPTLGAPPPSPDEPPGELQAFQQWLASASGIPGHDGARRIMPHGPAQAEVMLVSDMPGRDDSAAGQPIGGPAWELIGKMLAAIGVPLDQLYSAALAGCHVPGARLDNELLGRCAALMRRHIALARPRSLLLLGDKAAQALVGQTLAEARGKVHGIEGVPAVVSFHPRFLLDRPGDKARAWTDLLLLEDARGR